MPGRPGTSPGRFGAHSEAPPDHVKGTLRARLGGVLARQAFGSYPLRSDRSWRGSLGQPFIVHYQLVEKVLTLVNEPSNVLLE